jgi:hypothetical protein
MVLVIPKYPVPLFRLFLKMGGWVVLITGVLLVVFTLISESNLKTAKRFEAEGRRTVAVIGEKERAVRREPDGDKKISYWLTLEFITGLGEQMSVRRSVGKSQYQSVQEGGKLTLFYLASEPDKIELSQGSYLKGARVTQWIALLAGLIWLAALWIIGGWAVSAVRARRFGSREEAMVQEIKRTGVKINNRPRYRLVWRDDKGREGQSLMHKASDLDGLKPTDTIHIYQGTKRSWWEGDVGARA